MEKKQRLNRLVLFGGIYFVEGALLTYFSAFSVLYLRTFDLSYSRIGLIGGISLVPFVLKIFIGLLSDKVNLAGWGYRKPYILIGLVLQAVAIFCIQFVNPVSQFALFLTLMILTALGMSTYDTCSDGLSIDTTPEEDRGLVQGIMVGGRALSSIVFAAIFGLLSFNGNWPMVFTIIAVVAVLVIFIALPVKEAEKRGTEATYQKGAFKAFKDWGFILFMVLGILYPLALYSANGMVGPFLNEALGHPAGWGWGVSLGVWCGYGIGCPGGRSLDEAHRTAQQYPRSVDPYRASHRCDGAGAFGRAGLGGGVRLWRCLWVLRDGVLCDGDGFLRPTHCGFYVLDHHGGG